MSKQDFIYCEKGALPKETCNNIINFFEENMAFAYRGGFNGTKGGDIDDLEIALDIRSMPDLSTAIGKGILNYKKRYPLIDSNLTTWTITPVCQLMRYEPNKYYSRIHCENDCYLRPSVERCFAWMIYLNDIKRGGGTEFLHQKVIIKPRAGDFYIWPAGWTHMHRGINAPKEIKYIITGWYVYRDLTEESE